MLAVFRYLFALVGLSCFDLGGAAESTTIHFDGKVHVLEDANFSVSVRKNKFTFVEFYAPWCGACKQLEPGWIEMAKFARTYDVPVAKVDITSPGGEKLAEKHDLVSTPTLKLFRGDPSISVTYKGQRDPDTLVDFIGQWVDGDSVEKPKPTKAGVLTDWAPQAKFRVLGCLSGDAEADKVLEELIDVLAFVLNPTAPGADVPVGIAQLPATEMTNLGIECVSLPCVAILRDFAYEKDNVFTYRVKKETTKMKTRFKAFMTWYKPKTMPSLIPASQETESQFLGDNAQAGKALAIYFGNEFDEHLTAEIHKAAVELAPGIAKMKWVHASQDEFGENLGKNVGVEASGFPEFVVWQFGEDDDKDRVYKLSKQDGRTAFPEEGLGPAVRSFIEGWQKGKLVAEKDPVLAVTSETFESVVFDKSKDVLVEFYAPWCGHCKALAPEYKKVARHYESDDGIAIVKMDADKYKHKSAKVTSFPTLIIYLASDKSSPVTFDGGRDRQEIIDRVEKHRSTPSKVGGASADDPGEPKSENDENDEYDDEKPDPGEPVSDNDDNDMDDDEKHPEF